MLDQRRTDFCKFFAEGHSAEKSAVLAGYSPKYSRKNAYRFLQEPEVQAEVERLKKIVYEVAQKKFEYTIEKSFAKLQEIQDLALEPSNKDGEYYNLGTAAKVEELKAKLCGLFEIDNKQKSLPISINFVNNYE